MENAKPSGREESDSAGLGKSGAVAKAFWLGLVILGALTARDDTPRHGPVRNNTGRAGADSPASRPATSGFIGEIVRDQVWSRLQP